VEAHVLLADFAQSDPTGKVSALGLGWSVTSVPTPHHSVVVLLHIGSHEIDQNHQLTLRLLTADGQDAVEVPTPSGSQPLQIDLELEVGSPAGLPPGSTIDHGVAIDVGPGLPLQAGRRYEWRLQIGSEQRESWRAAFLVR
jgi:hypothetical protein